MLDVARTKRLVDQCWGDEIVPALVEYIKIPNKSPAFDPDWAAHGYMDEALALFERWARAKLPSLPGATLEVVRLPGRTPGAPRSSSSRFPARATTQCCSMAISTSSPRWWGGHQATVPGSRVSKATSSMAAAGPMTATRCSAR